MSQSRTQQWLEMFIDKIRSGELAAGERLPTHRQLAKQAGIALASASKIYRELAAIGLVTAETGRGTFVKSPLVPSHQGIDQTENLTGQIDLNFNSPVLESQTELLRSGLRQLSCSGQLDNLLHYQPHAGRIHQRAIIANHLEARGLSVAAEQLLIVSGAQHGLAVAVLSLFKPGDIIAVDALIYPGFKALAEVHRLELLAIPCSPDGPDLVALAKACESHPVKAIYTMPTMHNPLGWVIDIQQRQKLVNLARKHQLWLLEDGAYAFLAANPPPPLAALAPERTIYINGLSKNLATGFRLGMLVAPIKLIKTLERTIRATTWNTPALICELACRWVQDGSVAQLEEQKRIDAQARQQLARKALSGLQVYGHPSSYLLWLVLPEQMRSERLLEALLSRGISASDARPFATSEHAPQALRLALGSASHQQLGSALAELKRQIARLEAE